ncbi:dTDP-4-dehydrorhamnose 3,5-epimerase [Ornithinimicrobium sp. LYQ92]|uniref:dTDP-4-dehydrorhamnose 3,5-epimerase n=1 Tax=Serinicoccus sp. LYQ92 TaxID=3378798 RepID=UPI003854595E
MRFTPTEVQGCVVVDLQEHSDDRGFFARAFCTTEFAEQGLDTMVVQANLSFNHRAGTLRGMHRQIPPHAEGKLVRCIRGAIVDVALDLREDSPTFGAHTMVELTADNRRALWVPPYVAHGYQTLADSTEVLYQVSGPYAPEGERGQRYDDPAFGITWPHEVTVVSDKDAGWPDWDGRPLP